MLPSGHASVADHATYGEIWCPHTATAAEVYANLPDAERRAHHWVLVATAHPAKFREIVEPLIGTGASAREPAPPVRAAVRGSRRSIPRLLPCEVPSDG